MIGRVSAAAVLGLCLLASLRSADPPATKAPTSSVREVVYFGPAGPVRIRLHISVDGSPADAVWADAIGSLFAFRDNDKDGFLDASERTPFVPPARAARELLVNGAAGIQPLRLTIPQKEEKISKAAFAGAVRAAGFGGIGLRIIPGRSDSRQLSEALFRLLDQNGDGRLSMEELKAARERLAFLDIDEDEYITAAELLSRAQSPNDGILRPAPRVPRPAADSADSSPEMVFLTADGVQGVKQLLLARGGTRATSLKPAEFGMDAKKFAALDQDGNGVLDTTELAAWLRQAPDLELSLTFDAVGGRLTVISPGSLGLEKNGSLQAALPGGRFRFEQPLGVPRKEWALAAEQIRAEFKGMAKEKGFVERKQFEGMPQMLQFFEIADKNGDGKVDEAKMEAALKAIEPLIRCRIDIAFADKGSGLFELLDRNGDGRLSPRELVEAYIALKPFVGPDGCVGPKDLVRQFEVRAVIEPIPFGMVVPPSQPTQSDTAKRPANVPEWFTKMDRNGDGDVSLREFVGPIELFRKLDRNGDGLISPEEAIAAEKK